MHTYTLIVTVLFVVHRSGTHARKYKDLDETRSYSSRQTPSLTNATDPDDASYTPWSAWSPCYVRCIQKRVRRCVDLGQCQDKIQKQTRDCNFGRCRDRHSPRKIRHGLSRKLQDMVFDLLYNEWSPWSMCTRSCKKRRFRTCAMKNWCRNMLLMEEMNCYHKGTNCELVWLESNSIDTDDLDDIDKELALAERRRKRPKYPEAGSQPVIPPDPHTCGKRPASASFRIVGGYEVRRGSWPWQVAITTRKGEQYCGGVLIAPQWILTAAHCIRKNGRRRRISVRVGEYDLMADEGTEVEMRVAADYPHPDFNMDTIDGDIALVRLAEPVPDSARASYACLPTAGDVVPPQTLCYAVGWGKVKETHRFGTDVLREAPVPVVDDARCRAAFDYEITPSQMCAGYKRGGIDTCAGDSGGPLMCELAHGGVRRWYVYGITSFGEGCGERGKFGIYTKVSVFHDWIEKTTRRTL